MMKRFTVDLNEAMIARLEEMKTAYGFTSLAEVIRHAVRFMSYLEHQREQGYEVEIVLHKGEEKKTVPTEALALTSR
jgi:Arc/MetJ-type ribon-helix-helix transcriptional regulator